MVPSLSLAVAARAMVAGAVAELPVVGAVRVMLGGSGWSFTVTETLALVAVVLPAWATALRVAVPTEAGVQATLKGALVSLPTTAPSTRKSTEVTVALPLTEAARSTVVGSTNTDPLAGAVRVTCNEGVFRPAIHASIADIAWASTRFLARGGILIAASRLASRRCMIEVARLPGAITRAPAMPRLALTAPSMMPCCASGVS
jgi:hypothetical protein